MPAGPQAAAGTAAYCCPPTGCRRKGRPAWQPSSRQHAWRAGNGAQGSRCRCCWPGDCWLATRHGAGEEQGGEGGKGAQAVAKSHCFCLSPQTSCYGLTHGHGGPRGALHDTPPSGAHMRAGGQAVEERGGQGGAARGGDTYCRADTPEAAMMMRPYDCDTQSTSHVPTLMHA